MFGNVRGAAPVASSAPSNAQRLATLERQDVVPAASSAVARTPEAELHVELVVRRAAQRELLGLPLAREQLLRQRRPVVGQVRLGAHQHDPAVEPVPPQRLRGPQPCQ